MIKNVHQLEYYSISFICSLISGAYNNDICNCNFTQTLENYSLNVHHELSLTATVKI